MGKSKNKDLKEQDGTQQEAAPKKENVDKKAKNQDKKQDKNKKPNIFVRMGRKLKETFSELKRVTWPTFGKALKATGIVIAIVVAFTIVVTGVNFGFTELLKLITELGA